MSQHYSDPSRADLPHSLPDVETFYVDGTDPDEVNEDGEPLEAGFYWWPCFPGCLPDGDPIGPYDTEEEAVEAAQEANEVDE